MLSPSPLLLQQEKKMQAVSHRKENNSQQLMHDDNREAVGKEADAFHPTPEFSVAMPKEQRAASLQSGAFPLQCLLRQAHIPASPILFLHSQPVCSSSSRITHSLSRLRFHLPAKGAVGNGCIAQQAGGQHPCSQNSRHCKGCAKCWSKVQLSSILPSLLASPR